MQKWNYMHFCLFTLAVLLSNSYPPPQLHPFTFFCFFYFPVPLGMAFASADRQWCVFVHVKHHHFSIFSVFRIYFYLLPFIIIRRVGVVTGLATSLPRRYKVRFDESGVEEFVTVWLRMLFEDIASLSPPLEQGPLLFNDLRYLTSARWHNALRQWRIPRMYQIKL